MRPKKMLEVIEESVKSDEPIGNLPELVAAAEATRAELSEEFGDAKVLCNALQWFGIYIQYLNRTFFCWLGALFLCVFFCVFAIILVYERD